MSHIAPEAALVALEEACRVAWRLYQDQQRKVDADLGHIRPDLRFAVRAERRNLASYFRSNLKCLLHVRREAAWASSWMGQVA